MDSGSKNFLLSAGHWFGKMTPLATEARLSEPVRIYQRLALLLTGHKIHRSMLLSAAVCSEQVMLPSNSHLEAADSNELWQRQPVSLELSVAAL